MVLLLPDEKIAMHDTRTGEILWQQELGQKDTEEVIYNTVFITENFCGYATDPMGWLSESNPAIQIHDTDSGQHLSSVDVEGSTALFRQRRTVLNGPFLVYLTYDSSVSVIQVDGKKVTQHNFPLPMDKLMKTNTLLNGNEYCSAISLMGHLPKKNVFIGQLHTGIFENKSSYVFSLDLDAALAAKNEKRKTGSAFTHLMTSSFATDGPGHKLKPVYKTDLARECVDFVGVTKEKRSANSRNMLTIEQYFFVTEIEVPSWS